MKFLVNLHEYSEILANRDLSEIEKNKIKSYIGLENVLLTPLNIGAGADWFVLLLEVSQFVLNTLCVPKTISEVYDFYKKYLKKLIERNEMLSFDNEVASVICIAFLYQTEKDARIKKIKEFTINITDISKMVRNNVDIAQSIHNYYIQVYKVNDKFIYILGVKSNGELNIIKKFKSNLHNIEDITPLNIII